MNRYENRKSWKVELLGLNGNQWIRMNERS